MAGEPAVHHDEWARHACPNCFGYDFRAHVDSDVDVRDRCDHLGSDGYDLDAGMANSRPDVGNLRARGNSDGDDRGADFDSDVDDFRARAWSDSDCYDFRDANPLVDDFRARLNFRGGRSLCFGAVLLCHLDAELFGERHRQRRLGAGRQRHQRGGGTCPVANTTYSSALDAVVLSTAGQPDTPANATDCAHVRSQFTVPTSGDVVEAKIWLPGLSSATTFGGTSYPAGALLDWASMWTDGADSTNGTEDWPADTEVDAVETQYGASYVSIHYGTASSSSSSTGIWTTEPNGWEPAGAIYAASNAGVPNVQAGWNVVDIEFTSTVANIYYNGELFTTVPASVLSHDPAYLNFGIGGPNGYDPNSPEWPAGPATEDVGYVKVFS
ncbi:MAG: hypothetical protein ACRDNO_15230 [Trebonia sp.]